MSINASRFPDSERNLSSPRYSPTESRNQEQDSPIKKYMRQNNNFYLQTQQEGLKKNPPPSSTSNNYRNLKEFDRQLEQQSSSKNPPQMRKDATPKNNYSKIVRQEPADNYRQQDEIAYEHRAKQTQLQGNKVIDKIKNFILEEKPMVSPKSTKRKKQPELYPNVSSNINKLYNDSQRKESNRRQKYVEKLMVKQMHQVQPFKVDNPISLYLIEKRTQQNGHKPLYQRALDIAREKQQALLQIQFAKQQEKLFQQQQEFLKFQEIKKQKYPDLGTKQKQDKFYYDIQIKEKQKNLAKQQQKFRYYQQFAKQKPFINTMSKQMFNKMVQRDQLSKDFVKRTQEYKMERQKSKLKEKQKLDAQYCPFAPKISEASRELAQKYHERKKSQQQSAQKKAAEQKQLSKQIHQMSQSAIIRKSPSDKKQDTHKKTNSSNVLNKQKKAETVQKQKQKDQIPIYNKYTPDKRRTLSCVNVGCRKL